MWQCLYAQGAAGHSKALPTMPAALPAMPKAPKGMPKRPPPTTKAPPISSGAPPVTIGPGQVCKVTLHAFTLVSAGLTVADYLHLEGSHGIVLTKRYHSTSNDKPVLRAGCGVDPTQDICTGQTACGSGPGCRCRQLSCKMCMYMGSTPIARAIPVGARRLMNNSRTA